MDSPILRRNDQSGEEFVVLASSRPKKRAGRKKFKETRHPVYRGVRRRNSDKWVCEVREPINQKRIWLGTYPTPEMAARAHDVAALALRGNTACLNFADSVWRLPAPVSMDAVDIRRAAVQAAEAFRQPEGGVDFGGGDGRRSDQNAVGDQGGCGSGGAEFDYFWGEFDSGFYVDEDLSAAARGVLMSPPPSLGVSFGWDNVESDAEVDLWSYSI